MDKISKKEKIMHKIHNVNIKEITKEEIILLIDGNIHKIALQSISKRLFNATQSERENFKISPSGYGINWPLIDEDISIDGLLGIVHKPNFVKNKIAS